MGLWHVRAGNDLSLQALSHGLHPSSGGSAHQTFPVGCRGDFGACHAAAELAKGLEFPSGSGGEPSFIVFMENSDVFELEPMLMELATDWVKGSWTAGEVRFMAWRSSGTLIGA